EFDLLVTDLEMPNLSGYELIEQIRSDARWDDLPIVVLTGRASQHIQQMTMKLGADEFIIKPFKEEDLLKKIQHFIEYKK
ncbi:MAG: response regulator, partial [Calditrichia bacterium]